MKKLLLTTAILAGILLSTSVSAQQDKSKRPSPPAQTKATVNGVSVTIDYSQPSLKGREFGSKAFVPYGKIWRNGANENTWIELSQDVTINGSKLAKGKYSFFVIPTESEWTLIFNSRTDAWGAYEYKESEDVMRVTAQQKSSDEFFERYTILVDESGNASLNWGDFKVPFTIKKA